MIYLFLEALGYNKEGLQKDLLQEGRVALVADGGHGVGVRVSSLSCDYRFVDPLTAEGAVCEALLFASDVAGPLLYVFGWSSEPLEDSKA